jgi:anti-sigma regulatory factor (Ser/Thr protein kinase)
MITGGWRGPGWRIVDADPRNARQIRHWISSAISSHRCPVDAEEAALVADELFANAVLHGPRGGRVLAGYCLWRQGARLVVADGGGPGVPRLRPAASFEESGRGLHLVNDLAARWDTMLLAGARVVWCDLHTALRVPAADGWAWLTPILSACDLSPSEQAPQDPAYGVLTGTGAR